MIKHRQATTDERGGRPSRTAGETSRAGAPADPVAYLRRLQAMAPAKLQAEMIAQVRLATAGLARCAAEHDRGQQPGAAALKHTIRRAKRALSGVRRAVRLSDRTSDTSGRGDQ